jgi:mannose-6-phosphate isomerase-like protein (cupin superfamily)
MANKRIPTVVNMNSVATIPAEEAPTKVRIRRLVTNKAQGSNLLLGVCFMDPGDETNVWSFKETDDTGADDKYYGSVDETYFVFRGNLELKWDEGTLEIGPGDAVYLAPGYNYHLKNVGTEPAFFTYSMAPSPE